MGRPKTYTDRLTKTACDDMLRLFGTARNAYERLRLDETPVAPSRFFSAIRWGPCTPEEREIIDNRWLEWRSGYLRSPFGYDDFDHRPAFEALALDLSTE